MSSVLTRRGSRKSGTNADTLASKAGDVPFLGANVTGHDIGAFGESAAFADQVERRPGWFPLARGRGKSHQR